MTALDERPVTAPAATDHDLATFRDASREYAALHRHEMPVGALSTAAQRAGLAAVFADRDRHPASTVKEGMHVTFDREQRNALERAGWKLVGWCTHRLTGDILYVLERAEQGSGS